MSFDFAHTAQDTTVTTSATAWGAATTERRMDSEMQMFLCLHLLPDFADAENWGDLQDRMKSKGFALELRQGRAFLEDRFSDVDICTCRDLGEASADLNSRFGTMLH